MAARFKGILTELTENPEAAARSKINPETLRNWEENTRLGKRETVRGFLVPLGVKGERRR